MSFKIMDAFSNHKVASADINHAAGRFRGFLPGAPDSFGDAAAYRVVESFHQFTQLVCG